MRKKLEKARIYSFKSQRSDYFKWDIDEHNVLIILLRSWNLRFEKRITQFGRLPFFARAVGDCV